MALIDFDSFDSYGHNDELKLEYTGGGLEVGAGRFPGTTPNNAVKMGWTSGSTETIIKTLPTGKRTMYMGVALRFYLRRTGDHRRVFGLRTVDGSAQLNLTWNEPDRTWRLYRGATGSLNPATETAGGYIAISSSPTHVSDAYHYIELGMFIDNTAGWFEMRVHGDPTPIMRFDGDTQAHATYNTINQIAVDGDWFSISTWVDDWYFCDDTGGDFNGFLGDCKMIYGKPNADGSTLQMTPNAGTTHYTQVDDATSDGDTTYVQAEDVGDTDLYQTTNLLTEIPDVVHAVKVKTTARKTDAGTGAIGHVIKVGNDVSPVGAGKSLSTAYTPVRDIFSRQPNGEAWNKAAIDALEYGPQVKATAG